MELPKISIIVPCYNVDKYILNTLSSVAKQKYDNWQCIIIDDGSQDDSNQIIRSFIISDNRFAYHYQENKGLSEARNQGMKIANGDYLYFLDADDLLDENSLLNLVKLLKGDSEIDIVFGKTALTKGHNFMTNGNYLAHEMPFNEILDNKNKAILVKCIEHKISCVAHNRLYKSKFIKSQQLTFKKGLLHEDELWFFETLYLASKIILSEVVTYYYNTNNNTSITKNFSINNTKSYISIFKIIYDDYLNSSMHVKYANEIEYYLKEFQITIITHCLTNLIDTPFYNEGSKLISKCFEKYPLTEKHIFLDIPMKEKRFFSTLNRIIYRDKNIEKAKDYIRAKNSKSVKRMILKKLIDFNFY